MNTNDILELVINKNEGLKAIQQDLTQFITYYDISGRIIKILEEITYSPRIAEIESSFENAPLVIRTKLSKLNDINSNLIKRAKTGKCFTLGKHFNNSGPSKLKDQDFTIFIEFCIYATYNLYKELNEKLATNIKKEDSDKLTKKEHRDADNDSIQKELNKSDIFNSISNIITDLKSKFYLNDQDELIKTLNKLDKKKDINLTLQIKNELKTIIEQIKFLIEQIDKIIKKKEKIVSQNDTQIDTQIDIQRKNTENQQLDKEKNLIVQKMETSKRDFLNNLENIIIKIEEKEDKAEAKKEGAPAKIMALLASIVSHKTNNNNLNMFGFFQQLPQTSFTEEKKSPDTIDYEIEKFCNKYFEYFFKFAKINIYVIVNCSSILNDLAKALPLLIGLQLKKSIGTANQDELSKDKLSKDMKNQNLFGSGAFFNMYSLNIIKYIGFIYENSIPEIENLIGSVNDKYTRLKLLDNYLTSKYEIMVLGKEIHQKDNEKYEIDNPFIKNLLQDIFPDMGFSNGLIRKNIQNIDRAIEEHSDNIDLLQAELQEFLPIKFQDNGLLFANEQIQKIMIQDDDKSELKRIIKEKQDEKDKLTRLLAQAKAPTAAPAAPAAAPAAPAAAP